ncbi:MAG: hypothetical protein SOR73_04400 [Romboutsia timonensis]|uniref:hypothetical protein n=1 Tax=Romboutsia timonensis TaxID=1776391 RepID=UPI002A76680C|nr:hypothetical protein [Romboutsia timonensis]MDY3000892.1 hypothetical protein [Romboutsia timonensis]
MAMKKKFLGLAMAAMVALPASSVYAANNTTKILLDSNTNTPQTHSIPVDGTIYTSSNQLPAGKIEVELPTAMAFSVNADSSVVGADYDITNKSDKEVKISVSKFVKKSGDITIKTENDIASDVSKLLDRSNVALQLIGEKKNKVDLGEVSTSGTEKELTTLAAKSRESISLVGQAGKGTSGSGTGKDVDQYGGSGEFTLSFKIAKK